MSDTELQLNGTKRLRRILNLRVATYSSDHSFSASVYLYTKQSGRVPILAWRSAKISESRLDMVRRCLWIDGAAFEVSKEECQKIIDTFESMGLRITREAVETLL